jgi:hypothetical protein
MGMQLPSLLILDANKANSSTITKSSFIRLSNEDTT